MAEDFEGPVLVRGVVDIRKQGSKPGTVKATNFEAPAGWGSFTGHLVNVKKIQSNDIKVSGDISVKGAGRFERDITVMGDLVLAGADIAEQFDVSAGAHADTGIEPGTVVVLNEVAALVPCEIAYDRRVAGVVSGAGDRVPALILDRREDPGQKAEGRQSVAVVGKAWCRAEASAHPIRVGDLLTTSSVRGHARAANDREAAFGAVLGKALTPLAAGTGLVLVLVGLG